MQQNYWIKDPERTEQTVEFQSFRMRTFNVKGNCSCLWKGKSFMALKPLNGIVQRFRSKAFSPACLFRFLESSPSLLNCDTVSNGGGSRCYFSNKTYGASR
jgi:hypothetical protein